MYGLYLFSLSLIKRVCEKGRFGAEGETGDREPNDETELKLGTFFFLLTCFFFFLFFSFVSTGKG
jgi:hypothetical protein